MQYAGAAAAEVAELEQHGPAGGARVAAHRRGPLPLSLLCTTTCYEILYFTLCYSILQYTITYTMIDYTIGYLLYYTMIYYTSAEGTSVPSTPSHPSPSVRARARGPAWAWAWHGVGMAWHGPPRGLRRGRLQGLRRGLRPPLRAAAARPGAAGLRAPGARRERRVSPSPCPSPLPPSGRETIESSNLTRENLSREIDRTQGRGLGGQRGRMGGSFDEARARVTLGAPWALCVRTYGRSGLEEAP